jgi:hypothetical protein
MTIRVFQGLLVVALATLSSLCGAQGGPPFLTDDPGTPGDGNWEVNVALTTERRPDERIFNAPILDINYGLGPRLQLKYQVPYLVVGSDDGPTRSGPGKSLAGVKWRFYENDKRGLEISTYPQFEFNNPTSSVERGLVERGVRFFLPIEVTKKVGPVEINPEAGYWFASNTSAAWATGLVVARQVNERLELDGELYATATTNGAERSDTFGGGGRCKLGGPVVLLFMAGRSFRGAASGQPQLIGYLGLQFQFSTKRRKKEDPKPLLSVPH